MSEVSVFRLYALRAFFLLFVVGLGCFVWPGIFDAQKRWVLLDGQESSCMLAAFSLLCVFGLRYPLQMLPMLVWEVIWKTIWLATVPLPQYLATGHVDPAVEPMVFACSLILPAYIVIPWRYLFAHYITAPGDRWRSASSAITPDSHSWTRAAR